MSVLICGDAEALALAGVPEGSGTAQLVVALDDVEAPASGPPVLRWWRTAPGRPPEPGERVVAPQGEGLWSRAPWPVAEALFALPAAERGAVLVVEADDQARAAVVAELGLRGLQAAGEPRLTAAALARADVVLHGVGAPAPLAGDAFAVLAAGRLLITHPTTAFGLLEGVHYLAGQHPFACSLAESVVATPAAFAGQRRAGRLAAAEHRAPDVYARLLAEL